MRQNTLTIPPTAKQIIRGFDLLHPVSRSTFEELSIALHNGHKRGDTPTLFRAFETYRHPARQVALLEQTPPVTKTGPFMSAHQYGLAVDFVAVETIGGKQSWSWAEGHDWQYLRRMARLMECDCADVPISWDLGHVEHSLWREFKLAMS